MIRFHDDGFSIRSPDNGFYLHPLLRVQAIYTGEIASQGPPDTGAPDTSGFSLGRAEVILEGHVGGPFFQYRLQLDAAESPSLKDAYVTWQPMRMLAIEAGQFKVPYGLQRQYWKAELEFINISAPMAAFSLERDLGLMAIARLLPGRLTVQAGCSTAPAPTSPTTTSIWRTRCGSSPTPFGPLPATEGDIEGHVRPLLSIGAAGYFNLVPDRHRRPHRQPAADDRRRRQRPDRQRRRLAGRARAARALARGLAAGRALRPPRGSGRGRRPHRNYWGGYVQGSYFVLPHRLEVAARIGHTDLPLYGATADQRARLAGNWQNEQSGVVAAYLRGHRVKAQAEYSHLTSDGTTAPTIQPRAGGGPNRVLAPGSRRYQWYKARDFRRGDGDEPQAEPHEQQKLFRRRDAGAKVDRQELFDELKRMAAANEAFTRSTSRCRSAPASRRSRRRCWAWPPRAISRRSRPASTARPGWRTWDRPSSSRRSRALRASTRPASATSRRSRASSRTTTS